MIVWGVLYEAVWGCLRPTVGGSVHMGRKFRYLERLHSIMVVRLTPDQKVGGSIPSGVIFLPARGPPMSTGNLSEPTCNRTLSEFPCMLYAEMLSHTTIEA
jgi:hypothetical protein